MRRTLRNRIAREVRGHFEHLKVAFGDAIRAAADRVGRAQRGAEGNRTGKRRDRATLVLRFNLRATGTVRLDRSRPDIVR